MLAANEEWRDVVDFPGYEVSDAGRVRSKNPGSRCRNPDGVLIPSYDYKGRDRLRQLRLRLSRGGKPINRMVHHLVLEAFVGPRPPGLEGCHGDGNPANNARSNLRWDTHQANIDDARRHGTAVAGERCGQAKLSADDIRCIRAEPNFWGVNAMLARAFSVTASNIRAIRIGRSWAERESIAC